MCPWPFGRSSTPAIPNISGPIPLSFTSSKPELDRVSMHAFGLDGGGATVFDLVNLHSLPAPRGGFRIAEEQVLAVSRRISIRKLDHLHFTWSSVLPEISQYGSPRGYGLPDNPYRQHFGDDLVRRGFAADESPVFVSTLQYPEAASFFGRMNSAWTTGEFPVVLGLHDYPVTGVAGLTQVSSHAIESGHIRAVFAPEARWSDAQMALIGKPKIAVESWPRTAGDDLAREGRIRLARRRVVRDGAELL